MKEKKFDDIQELSLEQIEEVYGGHKTLVLPINCKICGKPFYTDVVRGEFVCATCSKNIVSEG